MNMGRTVFYISDGTGISAETLGHSLITQFQNVLIQSHTLPYIDTEEKATQAVEHINKSYNLDNEKPIVFSTIVKPNVRNIIANSHSFVIDFFQSHLGSLEKELGMPSSQAVGLSHAVQDIERYNSRMDAVQFALRCDDGVHTEGYKTADIILLGVSRCGKTPTCLYLALQYGIRAANYPLTEETLHALHLIESLQTHRERLFGLTISPERLHDIRSKRRPNSQYASLMQCREEIHRSETLFHKEKIPYLNSTTLSIEELSAHIMASAELRRDG